MIRKFLLAALMVYCITILTGCHTVHGVGQDIESAGHSIERATDK